MICTKCGRSSNARICRFCGHMTKETMSNNNSKRIPHTGHLKAVIIITVLMVIIAAGLAILADIFGLPF